MAEAECLHMDLSLVVILIVAALPQVTLGVQLLTVR